MALTFTRQPSDTPSGVPNADYLYPAYNDSYLEFSSSVSGNFEGQIIVANLNNQVFSVHRDLDGKYQFNLREIVKTLMNQNGFKDQDSTFPSSFGESYPYGYLKLDLTIRAKYPTDQYDSVTRSYYFIRGVKQIGEDVLINPAQILNHSENSIDFNQTYYEGFPFSFELQRLTDNDEVHFVNLNSGKSSAEIAEVNAGSFVIGNRYVIKEIGTTDFTLIGAASNTLELLFTATGVGTGTGVANLYSPLAATSTDTYRVFLDDGTGDNWTTSGFLPLQDVVNRIEVYQNGVFKTNLNIKQRYNCSGIYLKWFNEDGGYSYWLFDEYYVDNVRGSQIGEIGSNDFNNVGDGLIAPTVSLGIEAQQTLTLKTTVDKNEARVLRSIFTSPSVQLYTSQERYTGGEWIDIIINPNYQISSKKALNEVTATITLPQLITARL